MRRITLITTGGTIEKVYDEHTGSLENRRSIVRRMLRRLKLEDTAIDIVELLSKDSLYLTDADRALILDAVREAGGADTGGTPAPPSQDTGETPVPPKGIVVLHGTDTLAQTGELLCREIARPGVPIVLAGAMRPFEMKRSDALQNLTEAIFAAGVLPPGVYCVAHGRALRFPGVTKDRQRGTFVGGS